MATQNPIEQEGTYPLPEAQLDRFMLSIYVGYPSREEERQIVNATTQSVENEVRQVLRARDILWVQQLVRQIAATDHVVNYAVDLVRATRPDQPDSPDFAKKWLAWGAGPRAAQYLILGGKVKALMAGRFAVSAADVRFLARPVLRHRIFTNFNADAEGVDAGQIIDKLLETVPEPSYGERLKPVPPAGVAPAGKRARSAPESPPAPPPIEPAAAARPAPAPLVTPPPAPPRPPQPAGAQHPSRAATPSTPPPKPPNFEQEKTE
jgi:MoxR-like ATPase